MTGCEDMREGRADPARELRRRLPAAGSGYLSGALENPRLGLVEVLALLRNRRLDPGSLTRIARDPRWRGRPQVLRRIAEHPNTSSQVLQDTLAALGWKELADLCGAPALDAAVRRRAETALMGRLDDLGCGERVALARRAGPRVIDRLAEDPEERVLVSLLGNERLRQATASRLAAAEHVPAGVLGRLAEHATWGGRPEVWRSLLRNPATPVPAALGLVARLGTGDLKRLINDDKVPTIVRVGASRTLERRSREASHDHRPPFE